MKVATFNAHDNPAAVRRSLQLAGLLLWQEFPPALMGYRGLPVEWDAAANPACTTVNGWRLRWWDHVDTSWHKAHDGRKHVTPARGDLVTKLVHRRTGIRVAVVNGHRINRTEGKWLLVPWVHALWRARRWEEHDHLTRKLVHRLVDEGWTVIGGGDWNRRNPPKPHPRARWIFRGVIEPLYVVHPAGAVHVARGAGKHTVDHLGSDHPARVGHLTFVHPDAL